MANKIVAVEGYGNVEFPDTMNEDAIHSVLSKHFGGGSAPSASGAPGLDGPLPGVPGPPQVQMHEQGIDPSFLLGARQPSYAEEQKINAAPQFGYGQHAIPQAAQGVRELGTSGQRMKGAADVTNAVGDAMGQLMPMGNAAAPFVRQLGHLVGGIAGGAVGQKVAPAIVKHFGGSQDAQDLAAALGGVAPMAHAIGHAVLSSGGRTGATPAEAAPRPIVGETPEAPAPQESTANPYQVHDARTQVYSQDDLAAQNARNAQAQTPSSGPVGLGENGTGGTLVRPQKALPAPATDLASERQFQRQFMREKGLSLQDVSAMSPDDLKAQYNAWKTTSETPAPTIAPAASQPQPAAIQAYHGTEANYDGVPDTSGLGAHFTTDRNMAESFTNQAGDKARVIPVSLDIRNPLRVGDHGGSHTFAAKTMESLVKQGALPPSFLDGQADRLMAHYDALKANGASDDAAWQQSNNAQLEEVKNHFKKQGYDGLVYNNTTEGGGDAYVAFDKSQIKPQAQTPQPVAAEPSTPETGRGDFSLVQDEQPAVSNIPRVNQLEDQMRPQIGRIARMQQMLDSTDSHDALRRGIRSSQSLNSAVLSGEDRDLLGTMLGEDVGSALTPEQVERAKEMAGLEEGQRNPKYLNTTRLTSDVLDTLSQHRDALTEDYVNETDPVRKAKLLKALEPDENGKFKPVMYTSELNEKAAVPVDADHPEAPFSPQAFSQQYPKLTIDNLRSVLSPDRPAKVRSMDLGMLTPEERAQLKAPNTDTVTSNGDGSSQGTYNENTNGMGIDDRQFRKQSDPERRALKDSLYKTAASRYVSKMVNDLRPLAQEHAGLRDPNATSPLAEQLKKLPADTIRSLPKELRDLAQVRETDGTTTTRPTTDEQPAQKALAGPETTGSATPASSPAVRSAAETLKAIKADHPKYLKTAIDLVDEVREHFGSDDEGAEYARAKVLKVFHEGIKADDPFAMKQALVSLRRMKPYAEIQERNAGLPVDKILRDTADYVRPKLSDKDNQMAASHAADALLSRYEKMPTLTRSGYAKAIHDEMLDRLVQDAEPDGGFSERLDAIRADLPKPTDILTRFTNMMADSPDQMNRDRFQSMVRKVKGAAYMRDVQMKDRLQEFDKEAEKWTAAESMSFIDKMERGQSQGAPFLNSLASTLRDQLDMRREMLTKVRPDVLQSYYEDYFPHIWSNVGRAKEFFKGEVARGRLSGDESFLKSREHQYFADGIAAGLQPITFNPVRLALQRIGSMEQMIQKESIKQEMIKQNFAQFIEAGQPVPQGLKPLQDRAFEKLGTKSGRYFASDRVANDFNTKFASQGLAGKWQIGNTGISAYDSLRSLNNSMNIAKLGLSALHATESAANAGASELALGLKALLNKGDVLGASKRFANWATVLGPTIRDYRLGGIIERAIKNPQAYQEYQDTVRAFETANGRIGIDPFYGTHFQDMLNRNWKVAADENRTVMERMPAAARAGLASVGRGMELLSHPIMGKLVPRLKIAAFHQMVGDLLSESDGKTPEVLDRAIQQAWDSVDNRYGELVYDNMWMNRTTKDIMSLTMLSPGWNIGTLRIFRDGFVDLAKSMKDAAQGKGFKITRETAYIPAMVATTMMAAAIFQHLHPGAPAMQFKDYFFPRDGSKDNNGDWNRYRFKSYLGDAIAAYEHPMDTVIHKGAPLLAAAAELYQNKDYYGTQIADANDPWIKQKGSQAMFLAKQYKSFSMDNYQQAAARGTSGFGSMAMNSAGFSPAPRAMQRTDAENLANTYFANANPRGTSTEAQFEKSQLLQGLRQQVLDGKANADDIRKQIAAGKLDAAGVKYVLGTQKQTMLQRQTQALRDPEQAMNVLQKGTPDEQRQLLKIVAAKVKAVEPAEQRAYIDKLRAVAESLRGHEPVPSNATHVFNHQTGGIEEVAR